MQADHLSQPSFYWSLWSAAAAAPPVRQAAVRSSVVVVVIARLISAACNCICRRAATAMPLSVWVVPGAAVSWAMIAGFHQSVTQRNASSRNFLPQASATISQPVAVTVADIRTWPTGNQWRNACVSCGFLYVRIMFTSVLRLRLPYVVVGSRLHNAGNQQWGSETTQAQALNTSRNVTYWRTARINPRRPQLTALPRGIDRNE